MTTRGVADIVFCLDASGSMSPCFEGVRNHVGDFIAGLNPGGQMPLDVRFDFAAHRCIADGAPPELKMESVHNRSLLAALYGLPSQATRFFSHDVEEVRRRLAEIRTEGDEASLVALDCVLDFPWRQAAACHRVVILMTDEAFETGAWQAPQVARLGDLVRKIQDLKVMLYLVTPESEVFSRLSEVDKCEHIVVDASGDGLKSVDFAEVLGFVGKSVSMSTLQAPPPAAATRALYGQATWRTS